MADKKKILFAGGGTAGSVTPLMALFNELSSRFEGVELTWIGTKAGPEKRLLSSKRIPFFQIISVKMDRFFSLRNVMAPFLFLAAFAQSLVLLKKIKPDVLLAAGSFVAVPVAWAAGLYRIPIIIHQLDIRPSLSNKLIAPFAKKVAVTFEASLKDFSKRKAVWTGSPVRESILQPKTFHWDLHSAKPVVLIFGGGTGAQALNELVWQSLGDLTQRAQVLHLTGKGKGKAVTHADYHQFEFLQAKMGQALQRADVVVARAGVGTLMELAALKKPAVIISLPDSHQQDNGALLIQKRAAVVLDQRALSPQMFSEVILKLLENKAEQVALSSAIAELYKPTAAKAIVDEVATILLSSANYDRRK